MLRPDPALDPTAGRSSRNHTLPGRSFTQSEVPVRDSSRFPAVLDASLVGTYPASAKAGGGYVWDAVLEYRVWCYPSAGAEDACEGADYYSAFASVEEAEAFASETAGAQEPLALVLQQEYIDEPQPGRYVHMKRRRVTEWPVEFLSRPRRTPSTIADFLSPDAPANRLEILRGTAK